ncbi:hypothetical protein FRC02_007042 [Tulasnella sp. 418]|nr:hypothetical protein FRC02_007042 [Tulasnella sp. 418]
MPTTKSAESNSQGSEGPSITERWESAFVYAFITRFTDLKKKIPTFNTPIDLEEAILSPGSNPLIIAVLERFLKNLSPTCDVRPQHLEQTLRSVVAFYCSSKERSIWWKSSQDANFSPLNTNNLFFSSSWETKLEVLRQLVEWQLTNCPHVKALIDNAWGVKHHHKAKEGAAIAPPTKTKKSHTQNSSKSPDEIPTKEILELVPLGLDSSRIRYWITDDSPRIWSSGNPWKSKMPMYSVSSSRPEYLSVIEKLKEARPKMEGKKKPTKLEAGHETLIKSLEERLPRVDDELNRVERVLKRIKDKELAAARAAELVQLRETRTRAKRRVDYAAMENDGGSDDDASSKDGNDTDSSYGEPDDQTTVRTSRRTSRASSTGLTSSSVGIKRKPDADAEWRGERRSSRLSKGQYQLDGSLADRSQHGDEHSEEAVERIAKSKKRRIMSPEQSDDSNHDSARQVTAENGRWSPQDTLPIPTDDDRFPDDSSLSSISDSE